MKHAIRTTCPYCGVGCGVLASVATDGSVSVRGDPKHPANFGRLCSKGAALGETLRHAERLRHPEIRGQRCDWDTAFTTVAENFSRVIREHGPDGIASARSRLWVSCSRPAPIAVPAFRRSRPFCARRRWRDPGYQFLTGK